MRFWRNIIAGLLVGILWLAWNLYYASASYGIPFLQIVGDLVKAQAGWLEMGKTVGIALLFTVLANTLVGIGDKK